MLKYLVLLILTLTTASAAALITQAPNLSSLEQAITTLDRQAIVLIEVDHTLLCPKDPILRSQAQPLFHEYLQNALQRQEATLAVLPTLSYCMGQILLYMEFELTDERIRPLLEHLHHNGIKTLAFTCNPKSPQASNWWLEHLQKQHLDFAQSFPLLSKIELPQTPQGSTTFHKGLLCTNDLPGAALESFLEEMELHPSRILALDSSLEHLQALQDTLQNLGIPFLGLHYTALEERPCLIRQEAVTVQFDHLIQTGAWITEQEALNLLKTSRKTAAGEGSALPCTPPGKGPVALCKPTA